MTDLFNGLLPEFLTMTTKAEFSMESAFVKSLDIISLR